MGVQVVNPSDLEARVIDALRQCFDPEIPVNIYDLGLIYEIHVDESGNVAIRMTLTAPNCPAAAFLPGQVESRIRTISGVKDIKVEVVFDPPWDPSRMSEAARLQLGML
jgi:FeS assembly SUF system protein